MSHRIGGRRLNLAAPALLAVHAALLAYMAARTSPTFDESAYLASGLSHWRFGRFDLYRACPPLVRTVAAIPVLAAGAETDWGRYKPQLGGMPEFSVGHDFVHANGGRTFFYMMLARWACIPFSLIGGLLCSRWARELHGPTAGLMALLLWCVSPAILGLGSLITADVATASLAALAFYLFRGWLKAPGWFRAARLGVAFGLLLLTRTNAILIFALWPAIWVAARVGLPWPPGGRRVGVEAAQLLLAAVTALYVLNAGYLFQGSFRRLSDYAFASRSLGGGERGKNRFEGTWLGEVPVPLPADFVLGVDTLRHSFEDNSKTAYLRGEFRKTGWWYYYLYGMAVKTPLGTWTLVLLAATIGRRFRAGRFEEAMLLAPAASYLVFLSAQTGLNAHVRYALPIAPFLIVWMSKMARAIEGRRRVASALTLAALAWTAASSLSVYPHSLSYFNELAGGPVRGHDYLLDSNIDWGQDLIRLKEWLDRNPNARPMGIAYFGSYSPSDVGIPFDLPPMVPPLKRAGKAAAEGPRPGWYAISVNFLRGYRFYLIDPAGERVWLSRPHLAYFQRLRPVARAGYSIYIYHLNPYDAARLREELDPPPAS